MIKRLQAAAAIEGRSAKDLMGRMLTDCVR
jgi:hypothetical protein